jgi:hypothetical protein
MEQLSDYADARLINACVHCGGTGGPCDTKDHVPSKVLLDEPHPENLPFVPSCWSCINGFSLDEEYLACLVECVVSGTSEAAAVGRPKIAKVLAARPALTALIEAARSVTPDGRTTFSIDKSRVRNVALKLARGHAAYELSVPRPDEPAHVMIAPLETLRPVERQHFEGPSLQPLWPEVGSRAMQRLLRGSDWPRAAPWLEVQRDRYRCLTAVDGAVTLVRVVLSEYLACEVAWLDDDA